VARRLSEGERPLFWVGSSKEDLLAFPERVKDQIGNALGVAQFGGRHPAEKPWRGQGSGVFEVVGDHDRTTYRAVYTVRFKAAIYVLHAFQKKSPKGIKTARTDIEMIKQRLRAAERDYRDRNERSKS
jgi:phage-related protein